MEFTLEDTVEVLALLFVLAAGVWLMIYSHPKESQP